MFRIMSLRITGQPLLHETDRQTFWIGTMSWNRCTWRLDIFRPKAYNELMFQVCVLCMASYWRDSAIMVIEFKVPHWIVFFWNRYPNVLYLPSGSACLARAIPKLSEIKRWEILNTDHALWSKSNIIWPKRMTSVIHLTAMFWYSWFFLCMAHCSSFSNRYHYGLRDQLDYPTWIRKHITVLLWSPWIVSKFHFLRKQMVSFMWMVWIHVYMF